jgi:hypothetical protein
MVAKQGRAGEAGARGAAGLQGPPGTRGERGLVGAQGERGERGASAVLGRFRRSYQSGINYKQGDIVSHVGSVFLCERDTDSVPSGDSEDWTIVLSRAALGADR